MRQIRSLLSGLLSAWAIAAMAAGVAQAASGSRGAVEDYVHEPMPSGFQVISTELDGPVFADAAGHTLYDWPLSAERNGDAGEQKGKPTCDDTHYRVNAGLMSPYPGGLTLPDVDARPSCVQLWPPVYAADDAKPAGKWTVVTRPDGRKQWAYNGFALYISVLDEQPGDVRGGMVSGGGRGGGGDGGAHRAAVGPPANVPPGFAVSREYTGLMLVTGDTRFSVYSWDKDSPNKSNCDAACTQMWKPVLAPESFHAQGEWTVIERSPGIKQWAFRKKPLYTRVDDRRPKSLEGGDVPGWHNVYTQLAPKPPSVFTEHDTTSGVVLADSHGKTIYVYNCTDDARDQQACDNPEGEQVYRLVVCGGGDPVACLRNFPYVIAAKNAKSDSRTWSVMDIDWKTGHHAAPGDPDVLHVWAYRGRPVYTYAGDQPGDTFADGYGEFRGTRNGYKAFWLRDDFFNGAG